jgi:hypothetical protein
VFLSLKRASKRERPPGEKKLKTGEICRRGNTDKQSKRDTAEKSEQLASCEAGGLILDKCIIKGMVC